MAGKRNWMRADPETDAAKEAAWRDFAGGKAPHRAWYYSLRFRGDLEDHAFRGALRDAFWSAATKKRLVPNVDVKVDYVSVLPGVPILRVSMPERLVVSFTIGDMAFALYKAMVDDRTLDFGRDWGGLRGSEESGGRAHTVVGDIGMMMDGEDVPPPAAMLRVNEDRARAAEHVRVPSRVPPAHVVRPRMPPRPPHDQPVIVAPSPSPNPSASSALPVPRATTRDPWATFGEPRDAAAGVPREPDPPFVRRPESDSADLFFRTPPPGHPLVLFAIAVLVIAVLCLFVILSSFPAI